MRENGNLITGVLFLLSGIVYALSLTDYNAEKTDWGGIISSVLFGICGVWFLILHFKSKQVREDE